MDANKLIKRLLIAEAQAESLQRECSAIRRILQSEVGVSTPAKKGTMEYALARQSARRTKHIQKILTMNTSTKKALIALTICFGLACMLSSCYHYNCPGDGMVGCTGKPATDHGPRR